MTDGQPVGLSYLTYLTAEKTHSVDFRHGGSIIQSRPKPEFRPRGAVGVRRGGGIRGQIKEFSRASKKRILYRLNEMDRQVISKGMFVTLTYPKDYPTFAGAKLDLQNWLKRLKRKYPSAGWFWREELQKRGAPHFHVLILGVKFIPNQWVARSWYDVCGQLCPEHLKAGTEIKRVKSYKECTAYFSKRLANYISKESPADIDNPGRFWGVGGNWQAFLAVLKHLELTRSEMARLARFLDQLYRSQRKASKKWYYKKRRVFVCRGAFWIQDARLVFDRLEAIINP